MIFIPPIGLWFATGAMAARRAAKRAARRDEEWRKKKKSKDIDMGSPVIIRHHKRKRMCIKAQSDNPCPFALECGHGEPHICHGNDCLEPGHWCCSIRDDRNEKEEK